jgi:hypothetical protein
VLRNDVLPTRCRPTAMMRTGRRSGAVMQVSDTGLALSLGWKDVAVTPRKLAIQRLERGFHMLGNVLIAPGRWVVAECWRRLPRPHWGRWHGNRRGAPVGGHPGGLELRRLRPRGDRLLSCLHLANLSPGIAKGSVAREVTLMIRQSERRDPLPERLPRQPTALGGAGKDVVALIQPMKERRPLGIAGQVPEDSPKAGFGLRHARSVSRPRANSNRSLVGR